LLLIIFSFYIVSFFSRFRSRRLEIIISIFLNVIQIYKIIKIPVCQMNYDIFTRKAHFCLLKWYSQTSLAFLLPRLYYLFVTVKWLSRKLNGNLGFIEVLTILRKTRQLGYFSQTVNLMVNLIVSKFQT
jgi:hypothetical protein